MANHHGRNTPLRSYDQIISDPEFDGIPTGDQLRAAEPAPEGVNGRPSLYRKGMDDVVVALGKLGKPKVFMAAYLGVTRGTMHEWCDPDGGFYIPSFSDAMEHAMSCSETVWTQLGEDWIVDEGSEMGIGADKLSNANYKFQMQNRFKWSDKAQIENTGGASVHVTIESEDADL